MKKLISAFALTVILSVSVLAGDIDVVGTPAPPPPTTTNSMIAKIIVKLLLP